MDPPRRSGQARVGVDTNVRSSTLPGNVTVADGGVPYVFYHVLCFESLQLIHVCSVNTIQGQRSEQRSVRGTNNARTTSAAPGVDRVVPMEEASVSDVAGTNMRGTDSLHFYLSCD